MANLCSYKVKVKGPRNACYAFFGSMSCADDKYFLSESGTMEETVLVFQGNCKWSVDSYCRDWEDECPVELPEDPNEAMEEAENKYWYYTVQDRSEMFNVEVWCNSADFDDMGAIEEMLDEMDVDIKDADLSVMCYEHYVNGLETEFDDCPEEIKFSPESYRDDFCAEEYEEEY